MPNHDVFLLIRLTFDDDNCISLSAAPPDVLDPEQLNTLLEQVGRQAGKHDPAHPGFSHAEVWRDLKELYPDYDFIVEAIGGTYPIAGALN